MKRIVLSLLLVLPALLVSYGPFPALIPIFGVLQCHAQNCPGNESLEQIMDTPDEFIGCTVRIEGTLDNEVQTSYSIRTGIDHSLEVWPWAPVETDSLQHRAKIPDETKTMSYFVGKRLRLTGKLVKERSGGAVLEVSTVEELDGSSKGVMSDE